MAAARDMLGKYLRKWKNKVLYSGEPAVKEINQVRLQQKSILYAENGHDYCLDYRHSDG